jgi:mannose-1-phosphate guanylyltransferase
LPAVFAGAASESIDYGVMEKSARVALVEARFQWSDLGTWDSWGELVGSDARGNAVQGLATLLESENCLVVADDGLVATFGVKNLVVVRAGDVTLVLDRARCQEVRQILEALRKRADGARFL